MVDLSDSYSAFLQTKEFGSLPVVMNVMALIENSEVNGPGSRLVVWTKGCGKGCKGCFNPDSWAVKVDKLRLPSELAQEILDKEPEGLTLSGGDPLEQPQATLALLKALHGSDGKPLGFPRGIICFTGYRLEEIEALEGEYGEAARECLSYIDLLIDGRFVQSLRYEHKLAGSKNQRFHFNVSPGRGKELIGEDEVYTDQGIEVHMGEGDMLQITGFPSDSEGVVNRRLLKSLGIKILQ